MLSLDFLCFTGLLDGIESFDWTYWFSFWLDSQVCERRKRIIMAEREELIELRFRIFDGTDIGHSTYAPSTTIASLKQRLLAEWPQG